MNPDKDEPDPNASRSTVQFSDCPSSSQLGPLRNVSTVNDPQSLLETPWWLILLLSLVIGPASPRLVFAQTVQWKSMGLRNVPIMDLLIDEKKTAVRGTDASSMTIYAITPTNVFVSHGDTSWYVFNNLSLDQDIECFSYPTNSGHGLLCSTEYGLMQSSPLGSDWDFISSGFGPERSVVSISVARSSPSTMYAITSEKNSNEVHDELLKTTNGGRAWFALQPLHRQTSPTSLYAVYVDPHQSTTIYASIEISDCSWLLKSTDGGTRWGEIQHLFGVTEILDVSFDPEAPNTVYFIGNAGRERGIYKSTDGLRSYERKMKSKRLFRLFIHPTNRQILYCLEWPHTIHYSTNAGERWSTVNTDGLNSKDVALSMAVDSHSTIYLGIATRGVFKSEQKNDNHLSSLKALGSILSVSPSGKGH